LQEEEELLIEFGGDVVDEVQGWSRGKWSAFGDFQEKKFRAPELTAAA
jgi:hypothetical protein